MTYAIIAQDPALKQQSLEKMINVLVHPDDYAFDVKKFTASHETTLHDIIVTLDEYPIADGTKVVIVEEAQRLDNAVSNALAEALDDLPDSSCLILLVNPGENSGRISNKLKSAIANRNGLILLGGSTKRDKTDVAVRYVRSLFEAAGVNIAASTVSSIVDRVGTECLNLRGEVTKLIDYNDTSENALDSVLVPITEDKVFKLVDSFCERDLPTCLELLRLSVSTHNQGPQSAAFKILTLLRRQFNLLWQAKMLTETAGYDITRNNSIPEELHIYLDDKHNLADVIKKNSWLAKKYTTQAKKLDWEKLTRAFSLIDRMTEQLMSTDKVFDEPELVLSLGCMRMCA